MIVNFQLLVYRKNIFQEIGEIVGIYFSSTRHLAVVDFSTEQAAESVKPYLCCLCCIPGVALHSFYFLMIHVAMFEDDNTVYIDFQALYHFMGYHLMGRPLKLAWFDPKDFAVLRYMSVNCDFISFIAMLLFLPR